MVMINGYYDYSNGGEIIMINRSKNGDMITVMEVEMMMMNEVKMVIMNGGGNGDDEWRRK